MKKTKSLTLLIFCVFSLFALTSCSSNDLADRFELYKEKWESNDYESMYEMLSKESKAYISKEEFIDKYKNIYDGIEAQNITITKPDISENNINFDLSMDTSAGKILAENYSAKIVKEKQNDKEDWFLEWNESLIFPSMQKNDKVKVSSLAAKRGEIFGKSRQGLAVNGTRYSIGIYPEQYDTTKTSQLASILDIDQEIINNKLEKNTDKSQLVPIVKISKENQELLDKLLEIPGIKNEEISERVYPGGEAFGTLIGYVTPITSEELEKDKKGIYNSGSFVGKFGLETVYEETLRGIDGKEIYISKVKDGDETEKIVLAKSEPKNGKNLNVTIDINLQKKIYEEMTGETGASTAIDPKTGEVLAMVSSPSFDSNLYTTYIPNAQKAEWENKGSNVFQNRFNKAYSPGSTFKMITSTIGLEKGVINPDEKISIQGKSWRKDGSWGDYSINRVSQELSNIDLNDALIYSDNIYFAQAALKIGKEDFIEKSKQLGFDEEIPIDYPTTKSQITNDGKIGTDILLADTGYGQGQVLMSPLHLSMVYSALVNDGDIMKPVLETKQYEDDEEEPQPTVWKEKVISETSRTALLNGLVNVIEDPEGTGHSSKIEGIKLAGKTGTAELKQSKDEAGKENGWFIAMNVDDPKIVVSMIIEDVGGRGGSHFTIPKVRNTIDYYLKDEK